MFQPITTGRYPQLILSWLTTLYLTACLLGGLEINYTLQAIVVHSFILLACILLIRQLTLLAGASYLRNRTVSPWSQTEAIPPKISIIVPTYNEQAVIGPALLSLLQVNYPNIEIILVDDGSVDNAIHQAKTVLAQHNPNDVPCRIIAQTNGGKANALNTGLIHAEGEFILCVDADSRLAADSLRQGIRHFQNPRVAAVAGNVVVANEVSLLTRCQQLEYQISQNFLRQGLAAFGWVTVIPGPIGLFRRSALAEVHGYNENKQLFAEDADLTVRLLAADWLITSDNQMQAVTEAPNTLTDLFKQRYRWKRGIYQVLHSNFTTLITAPGLRRPLLAMVLAMESFLLDVLGFGVVVFMLSNIILLGEVHLLLGWLTLLFFVDLLALLLATPLTQLHQSLPLFIFQKLTYNFALQTWGMLALFDEWRASHMTWDKVERVGLPYAGAHS